VACQNYTSADDQKQVIRLLSLLPYFSPDRTLNPSWNDGQNLQPALELARDQINNSSLLLENYTLEITFEEAGCNQVGRTTVGFVMHAEIGKDEDVVGIIGPGCSASTLGLAPLTSRSDLGLVMVHGSGSPRLEEEHENYRYLLGTLGSTRNFVRGFLFLLEKAQWERIAILYDDSRPYHRDTETELTAAIPDHVKIEFSSPVSFTHLPLEVIKHSLIRIIYVLCPTELSQQILCLSHNKSMTYSNYQWVFMSQTLEQLTQPIEFKYEGVTYNCSSEVMTNALEKMFLMMYNLVPSPGETPVPNISYSEYLDYYEMYREQYNNKSSPSKPSENTFWSTYLYDVVWAWGLVLDNMTKSGSLQLNDTYGNLTQSERIVEQFYDTTFHGMSGNINFNRSTGFTDRTVNIYQIIDGSESRVVYIRVNGYENTSQLLTIQGSFPNVTVQENRAVGIFFNLIILMQLVANVALHIITAFNFKKPSIKASSPKLLHVSYAGTYLLAIGLVIFSLISVPSIQPQARCGFAMSLWAWFLPLGFSLAIGPVAMRTWRVYRIFKHYLNPGPLSNSFLFGGICPLLLIDVIVGLSWTIIDPLLAKNETNFNNASVNVKTVCVCRQNRLWYSLIITNKAGLLVLVTVLALLTRKIPNRSFTTNALRILAYSMFIIFGLGFSLYFILHDSGFNPNDSFVVILVLLNLIVCVLILCIFIPPVAPIMKVHYDRLKAKWMTLTVDKCSLEMHTHTRTNM
jgi:hypothetical protein